MTTSRRTLVTSAVAAAATLGSGMRVVAVGLADAADTAGAHNLTRGDRQRKPPSNEHLRPDRAGDDRRLYALRTPDHESERLSLRRALRPAGSDMRTMVIMSHSFSGTHSEMTPLAERLARVSMAGYVYDFVGGSTSSASGNDTTRMSVLTEKADLNAVFNAIQTLDVSMPATSSYSGRARAGMSRPWRPST